MKMYKLMTLFLLVSVIFACSDWLEVDPKFRIKEEKIFNSEDGFKEALLGVYDKMAQADLYGEKLTTGFVDILGQRYATASSSYKYRYAGSYNYTANEVVAQIDSIWNKMYNAIANCNNVLDQIDSKKELFTGNNYDLIKGELLALRAYMHFDLLRLFGPVDMEDSRKCLRYYDHFTLEVLPPFLTAGQFAQKVLGDVQAAEACLAKDPILERNPRERDNADSFWSYRFNRLNYYAVRALYARIQIYLGETGEARRAALEVIQAANEKRGDEAVFPWVTYGEANDMLNPDRIFHKEVVFGMYVSSLTTWTNSLFQNTVTQDILMPHKDRLAELFPNVTDYRARWFGNVPSRSDRVVIKYLDPAETNKFLFEKVMPMIRLSEMYLIAAECADSPVDGIENYINQIQVNRGLLKLNGTEDLAAVLSLLYAQEFYAEGQLFYFYKRKKMTSIRDGNSKNLLTMKLENYVLPLPDDELKYTNEGELD